MPTWICQHCNAKMTVVSSLVGQVKPCAKCGTESLVVDEDQAAATASAINRESVGSSNVIQFLLLFVATIGAAALLIGWFADNLIAVVSGLISVLGAIFTWPVTVIANEAYRLRRYAEEEFKRRRP